MANFQTEGQGAMIGILNVIWKVNPVAPPRPWRHCSTCGDSRPFGSSGKIRLNANGRRLDAWLIYKCLFCENTWNLRVLERAAVTSISRADLQATHTSAPDWVRLQEYDLAVLKRQCNRVDLSSELSATKTFEGNWSQAWSTIVLTIDAPCATGQRLDRFLANELKLSRATLQSMYRVGGLQCDFAASRGLKKSVSGRLIVRFVAALLTNDQHATVSSHIA
jgi:hypothetical protein